LREECAARLPALGAPAHMVMGALGIDRDRYFFVGTVTDQRTSRKVGSRRFHSLINRRMNGNCVDHCDFLLYVIFLCFVGASERLSQPNC
jgi:hypothetical protein